MDKQKLCSPCVIRWATLLTVLFLEQLCRTDAGCSWQLELALELAIVSWITVWYTARQALHSPFALHLPSQKLAQNDADDIAFSRVENDQTRPC